MRKCEFIAPVTKKRTYEQMAELAFGERNIEWQKKYNSTYEEDTHFEGYFHEWGTIIKEYEHYDDSTGDYVMSGATATVGICEDLAGNIHTVDPNKVKFINRR